jgi:hypothetical protein
VPGAEYLRDERAGGTCPLSPPGKRHALPDRPGDHRTCPSPAEPPRETGRAAADAGKCTLSSVANVKPRTGRLRRPGPWLVRDRAAVRGRPCKADGPVRRSLDKLSELLIHRGSDEATARFAAQIAIACYQTAKSLGNNPRTLADETQAAFRRALTLGTGTAETQPEPPGSG